jgi:8-oxo-dGTP diphosphatase
MPHIHTEPGQIDQTVTGYIMLRRVNEPLRLLMHVHRKLGVLLPVGGHVELTETHWQAIAHEITEESGYTLDELSVMQPPLRVRHIGKSVVHPQPVLVNTHTFGPNSDHYHSDLVFLFLATDEPAGEPAAGESTDTRWLTRDQVAASSLPEMYEDTQGTALQLFDDFIGSWEPVAATSFSLELPSV